MGRSSWSPSDISLDPTTELPYLFLNPLLRSSRETSEVYIICIYVVLYYVLCQLTRKIINKTASIGILVIGEYANNRITSFFDVQGDKNHRPILLPWSSLFDRMISNSHPLIGFNAQNKSLSGQVIGLL